MESIESENEDESSPRHETANDHDESTLSSIAESITAITDRVNKNMTRIAGRKDDKQKDKQKKGI